MKFVANAHNEYRQHAEIAKIAQTLQEIGRPEWAQVLLIGEEAGEFQAAYRKLHGHGRTTITYDEMLEELADVMITAMVMFHQFDQDWRYWVDRKLETIENRGGL